MSKNIQLEIGTIYKKENNGNYYFRYQVNGQRKALSLKTKNRNEAISKAKELIPIVKADNKEVIAAHIKHAKSLEAKKKVIYLSDLWNIYSKHPYRATPATVSEQKAYESTFNEFVDYINNNNATIQDITEDITQEYSLHLKEQQLAVDTHNRKIRRLKKVFSVIEEYLDTKNPFSARSLFRKEREELSTNIKRLSFSKEQEQQLLEVLEDSNYKVINKPEIRVVYHLGMFTGQRFKDCVLLKWQNVDLNKRRIWVKQFKTGKEVSIPIAPKLLGVLKEAAEWKIDHYVCPNVAKRYNKTDKNGKNTGNNLVNIDALRVIKWIGLEPSVEVQGRKKKVTVYGFHSLRHSFVSHCAEAGVPKAVVVSIIGANSEIIDKHYTHIGEEAQEKAIAAIYGDYAPSSDNTSQNKIDKVLKYINSLSQKNAQIQMIEKLLR